MSINRRDFLAGSAAAAALAALGARAAFSAQQQAAQPMFYALRDGTGFFTMRGGTIGYLVNRGAVVVVDSQYPPEAQALIGGLNTRSGIAAWTCSSTRIIMAIIRAATSHSAESRRRWLRTRKRPNTCGSRPARNRPRTSSTRTRRSQRTGALRR